MEVTNNIIEVLSFLFQKFGIAVDWTASTVLPQVEALMNKYIHYSIGLDIFQMVIFGAFLALGVIGIKKGIVGIQKYDWYDDDEEALFGFSIAFIVLGCIAFLFGIIGVPISIKDLIKCLAFPELKFFEYVKELAAAL